MNLDAILRALVLLAVANSAPVLATRFLGAFAAQPLDFNRTMPDGKPIFGPSKTLRGLIAALAATTLVAPALGVDALWGAAIAAGSMAGDLLSSFLKRRWRLPASSKATGLDQIPEALFGAVAAQNPLSLNLLDIAATVLAFFLGQIVLSRLSWRVGLRKEPY
ncbi:MAG TPA: CDP-archaeol synthase [Rhodoblastus sp.]|nr:CDP-archaeol synthase [Rhodoblastus sp.]